MEFQPQAPKIIKFLKIINISEWSRRYAFNKPSTTFQSCSKLKLCLLSCFRSMALAGIPKYKKIENLSVQVLLVVIGPAQTFYFKFTTLKFCSDIIHCSHCLLIIHDEKYQVIFNNEQNITHFEITIFPYFRLFRQVTFMPMF